MISWERERMSALLPGSRSARIGLVTLALLFVGVAGYFAEAKPLIVKVDGKTVKVLTVHSTVGAALAHSNLKIYPEDSVVPSRNSRTEKNLVVEIKRSVPVKVTVDGQTIFGRSVGRTVDEVLNDFSDRYGLSLKSSDEVSSARQEPVVPNMEIAVQRAVPVHITADGRNVDTEMAPRTVAEALSKLGVSLGAKDKVSLPLDHKLVADDRIKVVRVTERIETVRTEVPYQIVAQPADFPFGLPDRVISRGANGLQEQTVKLTLEDGKEVDREVLRQQVVRPPVNQVVSRGAQTSISRGGRLITFKRAYQMRATAYSDPGATTATGAVVQHGVVAVDPRVIPLGSRLYVDGYGEAMALDTGGAIKGNRIDLYMDSEDEAAAWGVRTVVVYVL